MTTAQLDHYKTTLEKQLTALNEASEGHESALDENHTSNDFVGPDRASEIETLEVDASIAESEYRLTLKIIHALERIERGIYGLCESCGTTIPTARLDAKPSVSLCLGCQEAHEAGS